MADLTSPPEEKKTGTEAAQVVGQPATASQPVAGAPATESKPETSKLKKVFYSLLGAWVGFGVLFLGLGFGFLGATDSHASLDRLSARARLNLSDA